MVIRLHIETWLIVKGGTKNGDKERVWVGGRSMECAGFLGPWHVWVYFYCCGWCLCQGL
jgi:hypothetical protein